MKLIPGANSSLRSLRHRFIGAAQRLFDTNKPDLNEKTVEQKLEIARKLLMPSLPYMLFRPSISSLSSKEKLSLDYNVNKVADIIRETITEDPDNLPAHNLLADCLYFQGRAQEAKDLWETLVSRNPDDPRGLMGLAEAHNQLHNFPEARRLLDKALTLPCDPDTKHHIEIAKSQIIDTIEATAHIS